MQLADNNILGKKTVYREAFLLFIVVCAGFIYIIWGSTMLAPFFLLAVTLACLVFLYQLDDLVLRNILIAALMVRLLLALIQAYTAVNLPGAGVDSVTFEEHGWLNAQAWMHGTEAARTTGAYYYSTFIGIIYYFFGRFPFMAQFANILFSLLTIFLLNKTIYIITGSLRSARMGALLMALLPTLIVFSVILLRETMIIMFTVVSFYYFVKWMKKGRIINIFGSFTALAAASALHGPLFILVWVMILIVFIYSPRDKKFRFVTSQIIPAVVIAVLAMTLAGSVITYQLPGDLSQIFTPDFLRGVIERRSLSRTTYLPEILPYSYFDLAWQTPLRVVYFLFSPFPWLISTWKDLLGFFDVLIYTGLFYLSYKGTKKLLMGNKQIVIASLLVIATLIVMFAWGTANYGTAWRHRQKIAPYLVVLASVGVVASEKRQWLLPECSRQEDHD